MKQTVSQSNFLEAFKRCGRQNQFSYRGLCSLFDWLEEYEDSTGEELELDPIGICCEFTQYDNLEEFQEAYGEEYETLEQIQERTVVIPVGNESFIIQQF